MMHFGGRLEASSVRCTTMHADSVSCSGHPPRGPLILSLLLSLPQRRKSLWRSRVTSEADLTRRAMLRASAAAGSRAEHPLGLCLRPSRLEAAKRVGSARTARVEHADRVFERALEFNQHGAMPFRVSKMVDENQRRVENRSQITGASRCRRGRAPLGEVAGIISLLALNEN